MAIPKIPSYPMPAALPENRVSWPFEPRRAALLVHDMQDYFVDFYDRAAAPIPELLAHVARLLAFARAAGMPVYYTAQLPEQTAEARALLNDMWGPGLTAHPERAAICEALAPQPGDQVLDKWRYSAFQRSAFDQLLGQEGRDQLVICGVYAHIGCLMTACEAFMKDIQPFFVADALADFSAHEHQMALDYVARRCGMVVRTADLADAVAHDAGVAPHSLDALTAEVARSLRVAASELRPDDNLMDCGLDSVRLMAFVETWRSAGHDVEFVQLAQTPTLAAWWALLRRPAAVPA